MAVDTKVMNHVRNNRKKPLVNRPDVTVTVSMDSFSFPVISLIRQLYHSTGKTALNLRFNSCEYTKDNPYLSRDCLSFAIQKSCFCTGYSTNFNILQFHHLIGIHICIIFSHRLSPFNSLRSHHPLKHFEVRIIPRRAIDRKFNGFKCVQIIRNHFFGKIGRAHV